MRKAALSINEKQRHSSANVQADQHLCLDSLISLISEPLSRPWSLAAHRLAGL